MYYYNQRFATHEENAFLHTLRSDIDYSILTHLVDVLGSRLLDDESKKMFHPLLQSSQQLLGRYKDENLLSLHPSQIQEMLIERQLQGKSLAEPVMREEEHVIYEAITRRYDYYAFLRMYKFDAKRIRNEYNVQQRKLRAERRRIDNQKWLEETFEERRNQILVNIRAIAENYKGKVSHALYRRKYPYSGSAVEIKELFGDWNQALNEAGVKEIMDRFEALAATKEEDPDIVHLKEGTNGDFYYISYSYNNQTNFGFISKNVLKTLPPAQPLKPVPPPVNYNEFLLYSNDGRTYLGKLNSNSYDTESVCNQNGTYGSKYSSYSIWNQYGTYGSEYSSDSAFNPYATKPPIIISNGKVIGYLTVNNFLPKSDKPLRHL